jgi:hypothetical protein
MPRSIITHRDIDARHSGRNTGPAVTLDGGPDGFNTRVMKYIPAEVVAVYVFVQGVINQAGPSVPNATLLWIAFGVLLALTPVYLWRVQHVTKTIQLVICTIAFAVWVFSLGGPFTFLSWYQAIYGAVLLPLFTFAAGIVIPRS